MKALSLFLWSTNGRGGGEIGWPKTKFVFTDVKRENNVQTVASLWCIETSPSVCPFLHLSVCLSVWRSVNFTVFLVVTRLVLKSVRPSVLNISRFRADFILHHCASQPYATILVVLVSFLFEPDFMLVLHIFLIS